MFFKNTKNTKRKKRENLKYQKRNLKSFNLHWPYNLFRSLCIWQNEYVLKMINFDLICHVHRGENREMWIKHDVESKWANHCEFSHCRSETMSYFTIMKIIICENIKMEEWRMCKTMPSLISVSISIFHHF